LEIVIALNVLRHRAGNDMNLKRSQVQSQEYPDTDARNAELLSIDRDAQKHGVRPSQGGEKEGRKGQIFNSDRIVINKDLTPETLTPETHFYCHDVLFAWFICYIY
jgi:hypothetical protein